MSQPIDLRFDVTTAIGTGEDLCQAAWLFASDGMRPHAVLVCFAGGTYDKHYWHLEVAGHDGYSFGQRLAAAGFAVVAVDHLGVGSSSDPVRSGPVSLRLLAVADADVAAQIRTKVADGTLHPSIPPADVPIIGVGHSLGACAVIVAEVLERAFDGVVLLGHSLRSDVEVGDDDELADDIGRNVEVVCGIAGVDTTSPSLHLDRRSLRDLFHAGDVPDAVVAADDAAASRVPVRAAAEVLSDGLVKGFARQVEVPVLLGFGEVDLSADPAREVTSYENARDVQVYVVEGSRHCHNLSSRRTDLWDAVGSWALSVARGDRR